MSTSSTQKEEGAGSAAVHAARIRGFLIPGLLLLAYVAQSVWFITTQSITMDEPEHICAGLEALRYGEFLAKHEHPPLGRMFLALPMLATDWKCAAFQGDAGWQPDRPEPQTWALLTRPMNLLLGLVTALLLWFAARRMFSEGAANFALALFAFLPPFISHFSIAGTDASGTLLIFAFVLQFARWRRNPTRVNLLFLGGLLGASLVAKFYSIPLAGLAVLLVLVVTPSGFVWHPRRMNWRATVGVTAVAALAVWASCFFHVSKVTFTPGHVQVTFPAVTKSLEYDLPLGWNFSFYLPAAEFFTGFGNQIHHGWVRGHPSFFLGQVSNRAGWKLYFPVTMVLKWPTVLVGLFGVTLAMVLLRKIRWPRELLWMLPFPALFLFFAILSNVNIGDRYLMPVLCFVLLGTAALWEHFRSRGARAVLLGLLALNAADVMRYAPDYLSWFNIFVRPTESWRLLSDSSLDWGQGLLALREYQLQHPDEKIHLAYFGTVDVERYGIRVTPLGEADRPTGTVVVSATHLSGQLLRDPRAYHWLLNCRRKALLNHSLHVFEVSPTACSEP